MLQNSTLLRKSVPWPPNSSDEHVSCTAPATQKTSCQILCKCPTPAIVFGNATKPSRFAHFLTTCTIPCACQAKRHLNVQTRSEPVTFLHFWLRNVLRATTVYTFSTSQLPRVLRDRQDFWLWNVLWVTTACAFSTCQLPKTVRHWCALYILTSKCASPQRCALFRHRNFQKCSDVGVLCTFWLGNVLRATTACTLSSLIWPHGSAPAALASLLFDPPEPQIIGKTQGFATFFLFHVPASFFFARFLFSVLLSSALLLSDSSYLCFYICSYYRKFLNFFPTLWFFSDSFEVVRFLVEIFKTYLFRKFPNFR